MEYEKIRQELKKSSKLKTYFESKSISWPPNGKIINPEKRLLAEFVNAEVDQLIQNNQSILDNAEIKKRLDNPQYKNDFEQESYRWISAKTLERIVNKTHQTGNLNNLSSKVLHLFIHGNLTNYQKISKNNRLTEEDQTRLKTFIGKQTEVYFYLYFKPKPNYRGIGRLVLTIEDSGLVTLTNYGEHPNYQGEVVFVGESKQCMVLRMQTEDLKARHLTVRIFIGDGKAPKTRLGLADDIIDNDLYTHPVCLKRIAKNSEHRPMFIKSNSEEFTNINISQAIKVYLKEFKSLYIPSYKNTKIAFNTWIKEEYPSYFDEILISYEGIYNLYLRSEKGEVQTYQLEIHPDEQGLMKARVKVEEGRVWEGEIVRLDGFLNFIFHLKNGNETSTPEHQFMIVEIAGRRRDNHTCFTGVLSCINDTHAYLLNQPVIIQRQSEGVDKKQVRQEKQLRLKYLFAMANNVQVIHQPQSFQIQGLQESLRQTNDIIRSAQKPIPKILEGDQLQDYVFYYSHDKQGVTLGHLKIVHDLGIAELTIYTPKELSFKGTTRSLDNNHTLIYLKWYVPKGGRPTNVHPRYLIASKIDANAPDGDNKLLSGVYCSSNVNQKPGAGEFLLQRMANAQAVQAFIEESEVDPVIAAKLIPQRITLENEFFSSLDALRQQGHDLTPYMGTYWGFTLLKQKLILRSVFRINEDTSVEAKAGRPNFRGHVKILPTDVLSFELDEVHYKDIHLQFMLYPDKANPNILQGFYNGFGWSRKYEIGKVILIRVEEEVNYGESDYQLYKFTEKRDELIKKYPALENFFFKEGDNNLVNNLGAKATLDPTSLFHSACYLACKTEKKEKEAALMKLQEAFDAGFQDKKSLKEELENGLLQVFKDRVNVSELKIIEM